jgi:hypothetical protein
LDASQGNLRSVNIRMDLGFKIRNQYVSDAIAMAHEEDEEQRLLKEAAKKKRNKRVG